MHLPRSLNAWPGDDFAAVLKAELKALPAGSLPLLHGLNEGGIVDESELEVSVFGPQQQGDEIRAKLACFFTEVIGGCNCHDDPHTRNAYCELLLHLDRHTGTARFEALPDDS